MFKGEKIFEGERQVKYVFQKSFSKTNKLIIVFSAFSAKGKPPKYNYVSTLRGYDCNKLFILDDFGARASYYLSQNRDYSIERSVIDLINIIVSEYNIKEILSCGSSKGGYAALYYGLKYGFNHIVVASPQYLLGDYLLKQTNTRDVATFISGSSGDEDIRYLNSIMKNVINITTHKPKIFIHLGRGEMHYENHVMPLVKQLQIKGIDYDLDLGNYSQHNDVMIYYPSLLQEKVRQLFNYPFIEFGTDIPQSVPLGSTLKIKVNIDLKNKTALYLYKDGKRIDYENYKSKCDYHITFSEKGNYKIKAFVLNDNNLRVSIESKIINVH